MTRGECSCGRVEYQVSGPIGEVRYCHCSSCRRASGSAFSANARIAAENFNLVRGQDLITEYKSSAHATRGFCSVCGSPLYARVIDEPDHIRIRLGGLEDPQSVNVTGHVWVDDKADWFDIEDDLPQWHEGAPGVPLK